MVKEMISDGTGNAVELEGEGDGDTLEVSAKISTDWTCPVVTLIYGSLDFRFFLDLYL